MPDHRPAGFGFCCNQWCGHRCVAACRFSGGRPASSTRAGAQQATLQADRPCARPGSFPCPHESGRPEKCRPSAPPHGHSNTMPSWVLTPTTRSPVEHQIIHRLLEQREVGLVFQPLANRRLVQQPVGLRTGGAHRRTLGRIQRTKLDARLVGGQRHRAAQRIDLLDQMPLADAADRRIARHGAQGFDVVRQQQRLHAHARSRQRGLGAGMATTHHDDIERFREFHGRHSTCCGPVFHVKRGRQARRHAENPAVA